MDEPIALNKEAGKENEQPLANLNPAKEATSKDEVETDKFLNCKHRNPKTLNIRLRVTINTWKIFFESLKESRAIIGNIPANISVCTQDATEYELCTLSGFQRRFQCRGTARGP